MGRGPLQPGRCVPRRPAFAQRRVVSSVPGEMFTQMRRRSPTTGSRVHRHARQGVRAEAHAQDVLSSRHRRSPLDHARAQGGLPQPGQAGRHRPAEDDVINTAPVLDPIGDDRDLRGHANVDSVFVAGNAVKRSGQLVGVDMKSVVDKLEESRNHILGEGGLLPDWCKESDAAASTEMANESVVVVGGTKGLGREVAQFYARGPGGRDHRSRCAAAEACAAEIGGATRGVGVDLAEPQTIAERLVGRRRRRATSSSLRSSATATRSRSTTSRRRCDS